MILATTNPLFCHRERASKKKDLPVKKWLFTDEEMFCTHLQKLRIFFPFKNLGIICINRMSSRHGISGLLSWGIFLTTKFDSLLFNVFEPYEAVFLSYSKAA